MSHGLIIRPEAELEIQDAFEWYEAQTLGLGSEFVRAVDTCLSGIGRNPLAYPIIYQQARRALVRRFPYGILYVFDQDIISVVACFHSKRNPRSWQARL
ncbi:type II toxin-antitoxin system RelE/ParE family toxin [Stenomitos frigidus]|uniref:Addiction module toxin RelE n=1 Tax=Stenomitos frigidus ULC18 TaxID=2107698 RepID=A0A2T1EGQ2_9CYAN|nr:type II toxin-antitoxin system RelE/ParE family toxin [Stenomitos frigidus]PSB31871.1 addiction module toxin RelE [Stenomitos frigidus ULC18]